MPTTYLVRPSDVIYVHVVVSFSAIDVWERFSMHIIIQRAMWTAI